jgi:hypothetical protein
MAIITKIEEFLSTRPGTAPTKPGISPGTTPSRPGPIRRDKPSVDPRPKAKIDDVMKRFMTELRKSKMAIKFDIKKLKSRYDD